MKRGPSKLKVAWIAGRLAGRRVLRLKEGSQDGQLGELLTDQLDQMKGLAMKLGQIASYMDIPLPESAQSKLSQLQTGITGLPEAETRIALSEALGEHFEDLFDSLDFTPIAAASIGQVHRATVADQPIALKLQYPNVTEGFRKDLSLLTRFASLASMASAVDGQALIREMGARLEEECDYEREASHLVAFSRAFRESDRILLPEVLPSLCTRTTLATTWVEGDSFLSACAQPQELRNRYATSLVTFSYRSLLGLAAVQADPHPGNFIFQSDGAVTFLDFGCVREFEPTFVSLLREMIGAIDRNDRSAFRNTVIELGLAPKPSNFDFDYHFKVMEHLHRPLLARHFEFTSEYVRAGLAYNGPTNPNSTRMGFPPEYLWVARLQWGLWSLLARLEANVELRGILDGILAVPITPLRS